MPFTVWLIGLAAHQDISSLQTVMMYDRKKYQLVMFMCLLRQNVTKWTEHQSVDVLLSEMDFPFHCLVWLMIVYVDSETIQFVGCVLVVTACSLFSDSFPLLLFIENGAEYWINHYFSSHSELSLSLSFFLSFSLALSLFLSLSISLPFLLLSHSKLICCDCQRKSVFFYTPTPWLAVN